MAWLRFDAIRRAVGAVAPQTVLELGCGQGAMATWLAARATYTGVEPDPVARATAARRLASCPDARVVASLDDAGPGAADLACAFEVLEHVEDDVAMMASLRAHLRPGGALVLSVPAHADRYGASDELVGHHRRYEHDDLASRLRVAGYAVTWIESYGTGAGHVLDRLQDAIARRKLGAVRSGAPAGGDRAAEVGTPMSGRHLQPASTVGAALRAGVAAPWRVGAAPVPRHRRGSRIRGARSGGRMTS